MHNILSNLKNRIRRYLRVRIWLILTKIFQKNEKLRKLFLGTILGLDVDSIKYGGEKKLIDIAIENDFRTFIDIGANKGEWSMSILNLLKKKGKNKNAIEINIYEPQIIYKKNIEKLIQKNKSSHPNTQIRYFQKALTLSPGKFNIIGSENSAFIKKKETDSEENSLEIDCLNINDLIDYLNNRKTGIFIKIDIESFDLLLANEIYQKTTNDIPLLCQFEYGEAQRSKYNLKPKEIFKNTNLIVLSNGKFHSSNYLEIIEEYKLLTNILIYKNITFEL